MDCPLDQGLLFANSDNDDNIYIYCISCDYKKFIGLHLYNKMKEAIDGKS